MKVETRYKLTAFAGSRPGGRNENQDTCAYSDTPFGFLITVCDGMGGGPAGKCASLTAANSIIDYILSQSTDVDRKEVVKLAVLNAEETIAQTIAENPSYKGMGTTVTVLLINAYSAIVAHVGDSRVYQFRRKYKKFRTYDHSLVFSWVKDGDMTEEEARLSDQSNIITRALGANLDKKEKIEVDVIELGYEKGDRFMLCTDGIWGMFPEKEIVSMATHPHTVAGAVDNMIVRVDDQGFATGGHHDNLTVAIIETKTNSKFVEKMSTKVRNIIALLFIVSFISICGNIYFFLKIDNNKEVSKAETENNSVNIDSLIEQKIKDYKLESDDANKRKECEEKLKKDFKKMQNKEENESTNTSATKEEQVVESDVVINGDSKKVEKTNTKESPKKAEDKSKKTENKDK